MEVFSQDSTARGICLSGLFPLIICRLCQTNPRFTSCLTLHGAAALNKEMMLV